MAVDSTYPEIIIRPSRGWVSLGLRELWAYRELLYFFVWRDLKVRYKQTALGVAWAVIQPLLMVAIFSLLFSTVAGIGYPVAAPVYIFAGTLPWNLFAKGLLEGGTSLTTNQRLITKVYFPRLILPAAAVVSGLVDFAFAFAVLIALMPFFGVVPTVFIVILPLACGLAILAAVGIACWLSAIDVNYRDVHYTIPFLTQFWFFVTPVAYPLNTLLNKIPEAWRWIVGLNPMTSVIDVFRWALLGEPIVLDLSFILSILIVVVIFVGGVFYFRRAERVFADLV